MIARVLLVLHRGARGDGPGTGAGAHPTGAASARPPPSAVVPVVLHTLIGDIRVELAQDRAPATVANFLRYVDGKRFDGITSIARW